MSRHRSTTLLKLCFDSGSVHHGLNYRIDTTRDGSKRNTQMVSAIEPLVRMQVITRLIGCCGVYVVQNYTTCLSLHGLRRQGTHDKHALRPSCMCSFKLSRTALTTKPVDALALTNNRVSPQELARLRCYSCYRCGASRRGGGSEVS